MKRTTVVLLALWIGILPAAALAQGDRHEDPTAGEDLTPAEEQMLATDLGSTATEHMPLRLADAVVMGIENNLSLQVQRFDPLIAGRDEMIAWGSYDPTLSGEAGYSKAHIQNANPLLGSARNRTETWDTKAGVRSLVPYLGASLEVDVTGGETNTTQFSTFQTLRPQWDTSFQLTGTMPLLRGLIWNQPWTRVKSSQSAYHGAQENFRTDLMDIVQFIEVSYWALVAQIQAVRVAEKSLETARSLLDQTQTQYDVGVKSKVEVVEAEAGVADREFQLIVANNSYRRSQDDLIDAVLGKQLTAATKLEIVPEDDPENYVTYTIDTVEAAKRALENRPELQEARAFIEQSEYQLKFAKSERLPQLDFVASYGVGGLRGTGVGANPTTGNFNDTFEDWFTSDGSDNYSFRTVLSIPIGNVAGRNTVSRSELELHRAQSRLMRLRQDIILEVRDGARSLASAQEGIQAAERRRLAAEEQLRAERVRLEYGESTPFRVLEKEEDLVEAENQKIAALFTYRRSVVDLHRAQGTILKARNIVVDEAAALR